MGIEKIERIREELVAERGELVARARLVDDAIASLDTLLEGAPESAQEAPQDAAPDPPDPTPPKPRSARQKGAQGLSRKEAKANCDELLSRALEAMEGPNWYTASGVLLVMRRKGLLGTPDENNEERSRSAGVATAAG